MKSRWYSEVLLGVYLTVAAIAGGLLFITVPQWIGTGWADGPPKLSDWIGVGANFSLALVAVIQIVRSINADKEARERFALERRAWLKLEPSKLSVKDGQTEFRLSPRLKNVGNTIAENVVIKTQVHLSEETGIPQARIDSLISKANSLINSTVSHKVIYPSDVVDIYDKAELSGSGWNFQFVICVGYTVVGFDKPMNLVGYFECESHELPYHADEYIEDGTYWSNASGVSFRIVFAD